VRSPVARPFTLIDQEKNHGILAARTPTSIGQEIGHRVTVIGSDEHRLNVGPHRDDDVCDRYPVLAD